MASHSHSPWEPTPPGAGDDPQFAVVTHGLRKKYGSVVAVDGLDLRVPQGSLFGLLGRNGAGKSTTFSILCGFVRATAGSAEVLGVPSGQLHRLEGRVSALPQDAEFPPHVPIVTQLRHFGRLMGQGASEARYDTDRVLEAVGLSHARRLRGGELSHGMRKRAGLAQALLGSPQVVLLDEPTAGLDPSAGRQVKDLIANLTPHATVVLASHNLAEVQELCSHAAIIDKGKQVGGGTLQELTRRSAEVCIEVATGADIPWVALREAFGQASVSMRAAGELHIGYAGSRDAADAIGVALRMLLDHGTPILGVQRGTSLETTFLEMTDAAR